MKQNFIGKYIGPDQIKEISISERKTYLGNEVIAVIFENGEKEEYPAEILKNIITKEKSDLSKLRNDKVEPLLKKIIGLLAESELTKSEIQYALGPVLEESLNGTMERAKKILWGKDPDKVTLYDIEQILKQNEPKKANNNKSNKA